MNLDKTKARTDPIYFANEFLGMPLHEGQIKYLTTAREGIPELAEGELIRKFVLTCANRWGKSAVIAVLQLWFLFNKFGVKADPDSEGWFDIAYRTANIAPFSSLTEPVFIAMKAIMTSTYPIRDEEGNMTTNKCKIEWFYDEERTINSPPYKLFFMNNSMIEHLSLMGGKGDNLQGKPYGLITYDEATRSDHLQMELDNSILGRLLDWTAPLHLIGTPDQDGNSMIYMHDIYEKGLARVDSTYTQEGSIYENKFLTKQLIADQEELLKNNPLKDQMLHGKFIWGTDTIFPAEDILAAQTDELNNGERYKKNHQYVIGVDTAIGSDEMVYCVLDITEKPYRMVWMDAVKGSSRSPQMHLNALCNLFDSYRDGNNIQMVIETFNGESARFYQDLPPYIQVLTSTVGTWQPNRIRTDNKNPETNETAKTQKADLIIALKKLLAEKEILIPRQNYDLVKQLSIYKEDDKRLPTDRVIALCLASWMAEENNRKPVELQLIEL